MGKIIYFVLFLLVSTSTAQTTAISDGQKYEVAPQTQVALPYSSSIPAIGIDYLDKIEIRELTSQKTSTKPITVVVDSGICYYFTPPKVNSTLSKGWAGNKNPLMDESGHGCRVSAIVDSINPNTEFISLKVVDQYNKGTLEDLISALETISGWKIERTFVVNMSLQNYPPSDKVKSLMQKSPKALFVLISGNNGSQTPNFPGYYSMDLTNVITVGSAESDDSKSSYSGYGNWTDLVGFGTLTSYLWGTSYAAPQVSGIASLLLQVEPGLPPYLLRQIIIAGGKSREKLEPFIGIIPLNGREVNGDSSLAILKKMRDLEVYTTKTSYSPSEISRVASSEIWWSQITQGAKIELSGSSKFLLPTMIEGDKLIFIAPTGEGEYNAQVLVDGYKIGKSFVIKVTAPSPKNLASHSDGSPVTENHPLEKNEKFFIYSKLSLGESKAWVLVDSDKGLWWEINSTNSGEKSEYNTWNTFSLTLSGRGDPLPILSGKITLLLSVNGEYSEPIEIFVK